MNGGRKRSDDHETHDLSERGIHPEMPGSDEGAAVQGRAHTGAARQRLCICADDFGLSAGINAGIVDLAEAGKISAAGCMVNRDAWKVGVRALRHVEPARLDVGLHLDFGFPSAGQGADRRVSGLILRSYLGLLDRTRVRQEIRDQLDRFDDGMDRPPAFVDGHQHVHQLPVIRQALLDEVLARYGAARPWIRSTEPAPQPFRGTLKEKVIFGLGGASLKSDATARGLKTNDRLLGVYDFGGSPAQYRERLARWLMQCQTGDVLMCHPSVGGAEFDVPHAKARWAEYLALGELRWPRCNETENVELAPLSAIRCLQP